ncbi:MAG TPA: DEAD/DEAH box helicase [Paludibacteraceae bacterium]|nr:DEAD/DEAH box helicase [Paludibacteraceae bacterium]HOU68643.1 DEAD/DEAH box helicase [Paludibacteraceae bacterium]HPH62188.1 DEAD/DEAH box helicase [Paludibacteraceae bacterium]HQF50185.1 DEAD/DEAH box helicase [Paludibacteraceae bacterium]
MTFKELGLKEEILKGIEDLGFTEPMPIQEKVTPFLLSEDNSDLVALAQTGTGKTAGFGLPLLHLIDASVNRIQALVLSPTRELCIQISNDLKNYSKYIKGFKVVPVYGGESIIHQYKQLDVQPQVLVATPGRLIDLIERGKVNLSGIKYLVLDEADEMLNMGFQDDIERILQETPENRRTLLFSATMPSAIAHIAKKYMKDSVEISIGRKNAGAENVRHIYYMVPAKFRYEALKRIVDVNPDIYAIVFCRTRQETKDVADHLMADGYNADALHGDLSQIQRDSVMQKFRVKTLQLLVATDVAARGLDVSDLTHVINFNLPDDIESYTHRSGRTGRANKSGISISIVHSKESGRIRMIEKIINKKFEKGVVPTGLDVCQSQLFSLINKMKEAQVDEQIEQYLPIVIEQLNDMDKETIIKKFVSLEFNRFLNYYKDAQDINVEGRDNSERSKKRRNGDLIRLKINLGQKDGFTPKRILGIINDTTGDKGIEIRDIEITPRYSFFDVDSSDVKRMIDAFAANDNDGVVLAEAKESRSRSFDRGGDRSGSDRGGDRGGFDRGGDRRRSRSDRDRGDRDRSSFRDRDRSHDRDRRSDSSSEWRHTKEENAFSKKSSKKYSRDSFSRHK